LPPTTIAGALLARRRGSLAAFGVAHLLVMWGCVFEGLVALGFASSAENSADVVQTLVIGAAIAGAVSMMGLFASRRDDSPGLATSSLFISLGVQGVGAAWMVTNVKPTELAKRAVLTVLGGLGAGLLMAMFAYAILHGLTVRLWHRWRVTTAPDASFFVALRGHHKKAEVALAARTLQRFMLRATIRRKQVRRRELSAWAALKCERNTAMALAYFSLISFCLAGFWVVLLFGVKFTQSQTQAWFLTSITSFALDIFITEPFMILMQTMLIECFAAGRHQPTRVWRYDFEAGDWKQVIVVNEDVRAELARASGQERDRLLGGGVGGAGASSSHGAAGTRRGKLDMSKATAWSSGRFI